MNSDDMGKVAVIYEMTKSAMTQARTKIDYKRQEEKQTSAQLEKEIIELKQQIASPMDFLKFHTQLIDKQGNLNISLARQTAYLQSIAVIDDMLLNFGRWYINEMQKMVNDRMSSSNNNKDEKPQ